MTLEVQSELDQLKASYAGLEAKRSLLGDAIVNPALASLQEKIAYLEARLASETDARLYSSEERRIVTILFADIVGSTPLAESLDPEEWSEIIAAVHAAAGEQVVNLQGRVLQYLGDGLLAVFGIDSPNETDPENAINAGLRIQQSIGFLETPQPIQMRIGIHTGLVLLGDLSLPARQELTAVGDAMNTAARLQNLAPPGGVLISRDTYRYVRGLFEFIPQSPVQLKGKRDPIQTYLVIRAFPSRFRMVNRGIIGVESEIVGRQAEIEQLRAAYQRLSKDGGLGWIQIIGLPGIGKSRLVSEFRKQIEMQGDPIYWIKARAHPGDERRTYNFLRKLLLDYFQIHDGLPRHEAEHLFIAGVKDIYRRAPDLFPLTEAEIIESAHALGHLVGMIFSDSLYLAVGREDPAQLKGQAYVLTRLLLSILRSRKTVVILLEDLQWLDGESWDFIANVLLEPGVPRPGESHIDQTAWHGMFILATGRLDWQIPAQLTNHPNYFPIELGALDRASAVLMVEHLLSSIEGTPQAVIDEIVERAEGIPYYAEELINWLIDQEIIDSQSQPWRFERSRWGHIPLPDTLQHLLLTRLGLAPKAEQQVIKCASVFGKHFWENGVEALGARNSHEMLIQAQARGIVLPESEPKFPGEREWSFYQNLLREVAYTSLLLRERKQMHESAAAWLEEQAHKNGRLDEFAGILAEHYDMAGIANLASNWYLKAGREAKTRAAFEAARRLLDRALELANPKELRHIIDILLERNEVLGILGDSEARQLDDNTLIALAQELQDDHLLATAYLRSGTSKTKTWDQPGAIDAFDVALAAARRAGDQDTAAIALSLIAMNKSRLGEIAAAVEAIDDALSLAESGIKELSRAMVITNASACFAEIGDLTRALRLTSQQVEITRKLSNIAGEARGLLNLGYFYLQLGKYEAGKKALEQAHRRAQTIGARHISALARLNLALANWRLGHYEEAAHTLKNLKAELDSVGDVFGHAVCHTYLGLVLEKLNNHAAAYLHFSQATQDLRRLGMPGYLHDALAGLVRCSLQLGDDDAARQYVDELWEYLVLEKAAGLEFPQLAFLTCARGLAQSGNDARARNVITLAYRDLNQRADRISEADWYTSFLENVPENRKVVEAHQLNQRLDTDDEQE